MAINPPIDATTAEGIFTLLRSIAQPFTEADARGLIDDKGWPIDADAPGEGAVTSGDWAGSDEAIMFRFVDGLTANFTISAFAAPASDPASKPTAVDTFAMLVQLATEMFGPRSGELITKFPRAWWTLPEQTIAILRADNATVIIWSTHEDHDDVIRSASRAEA